jgi:outer membrane protein assembly factor BamB
MRPSESKDCGRAIEMKRCVCHFIFTMSLLVCPPALAQDWTHYGGGTDRVATRTLAFDPTELVGLPVWTVSTGPVGESIFFAGRAGVVEHGDDIVALGWVDGAFSAIDVGAADGLVRWMTPVDSPFVDSWSSPAIDTGNGSVVVASGQRVVALSLVDGSQLWQVTLDRQVVNASPLVTDSLGAADRVFVTDFGFSGQVARLYCINVDPFDISLNPYQPGEVVWSVGVGEMSGASPTLAGANVIVATSDGRIVAYPVSSSAPPEPAWDSPNPGGLGLFSGVSVRGGAVYAASYNFSGGLTSSNLVKLDAATGQVLWTVGSNRTDALPIPLADGRILLSTGLEGFGSHPSLQLFQDNIEDAVLVWDSFLDGGPVLGYWTHTPVVLESMAGAFAVVGVPPPGDPFGPSPASLVVDLDLIPSDSGFVIETLDGVGVSAVTANGRVLGVGESGLSLYQLPLRPCQADFNQSGEVDFFDIISFLDAFSAGDASADLTGDGVVNFFDLQVFLTLFIEGCN